MEAFKKLVELCQLFLEGGIEITDFQNRISTLPYPDGCSKKFYNLLHNVINRLEEIIFCNAKSEYLKLGSNIVDILIKEAELEMQRLKDYQPYQK